MSYSDLTDCRHCGENTGFMLANNTELIGNYKTVLCQGCLNTFHLYMRDHPTFIAFRAAGLNSDILLARTCGDGVDRTEELKELDARKTELSHELYGLSEAWVLSGGDKKPPSQA